MYKLSPSARLDLQNIWSYSYKTFGEDQANSYIDKLHHEFGIIADMPNLGIDQTDLRAGYRSKHCMRHKIFYKQIDDIVVIMRILHERMSPEMNI